jgi:hypothetical protein
MGLTDDVTNKFIPDVSPSCIQEFSIVPPPMLTNNTLQIRDFSGMIYSLKKINSLSISSIDPNDCYMMNGLEAFTAIEDMIRKCTVTAQNIPIQRLIITQDKRDNDSIVRLLKEYRKKQYIPYPAGTLLSEQGIKLPNFLTWEKMDIRRIYSTGRLASLLFALAIRRMQHTQVRFICPVVLDGEVIDGIQAPIVFEVDGTNRLATEWRNNIQESDLMGLFYTYLFVKDVDHVCIVHRDSDQIATALRYLSVVDEEHSPKKFTWVASLPHTKIVNPPKPGSIVARFDDDDYDDDGDDYGESRNNKRPRLGDGPTSVSVLGVSYDLLRLYKDIKHNYHYFVGLQYQHALPSAAEMEKDRVNAFVLLCILCGTDFVPKNVLSYYIKTDAMWKAIQHTWYLWRTALAVWDKQVRDNKRLWSWEGIGGAWPIADTTGVADEALIDLFVRWEYTVNIKKETQRTQTRLQVSDDPPSPYQRVMIRQLMTSKSKGNTWRKSIGDSDNDELRESVRTMKNRIKFNNTYWVAGWRIDIDAMEAA